ncbi:hypothetical protein HDU98_000663, partial [Podochytrium sp. JEL0797]
LFILYKSYVIMRMNKNFGRVSILVGVYRFVWGILDYIQNSTTGLYFTIGDILCDLLATIGPISTFISQAIQTGFEFKTIMFHMVKENVWRSVFVLIIEIIFLYSTFVPMDPNLWSIMSVMQDAVYVILMNTELFLS